MTTRVRDEKKRASKRASELIAEKEETKLPDVTALKADMDAVLDDIDAVLEQNAQEFVESYIQKGGQ